MKNLPEFNRLKNIQNYLEKNDDLAKFLTKYGDDFGVCEYKTQLEKSRQSDCELLQKTLCDIFEGLETNKNAITNHEVDDLRLFKRSMIEIQDKLHNIHAKSKRDLLRLEDLENNLSIELEPYKERFEQWSQPPKKILTSYKNTTKPKENTTKEVKEFHDFVACNGGHYNHWSVDDHQLFLKMRKKYRNIDLIIENLQRILPDKTTKNIHEHEDWYRNYTILQNRMKDSLKIWRESRDKNKPETTDCGVNNKINKNCIKNDEDIKMKIAQWKIEKQQKRQQELDLEAVKNQQLKQIELNKRHRNGVIKESIRQQKEVKENRMKEERLKQEKIESGVRKQKAKAANKMIKQFQTQDDLYIARRRNFRKNDEKIVERSKSSHTVDRDPERLFKPTQQWLRKIAKQDDYFDVTINIPNVYRISKLKIPEWRRNI